MAFKDVVAIFTDDRRSSENLRLASEVAEPVAGHLIGLYLMAPITLLGGGVPFAGTETEMRALEAIEAERRANAMKAASRVERALQAIAERDGRSYEWRLNEGDVVRSAVLHARHADIAILGQNDPDHPATAPHLVASVLLSAGRPVLVVPYAGSFETVGRTVLVGWNGSREAARALGDAMPILQKAEKVVVLSVNPPGENGGGSPWPGAGIALHLARHGVPVEASSTVSHDIDVGNVLLSRAADLGSDLIVIGGYGHSRQREFILGGVTRTLLQHMTVPVLMSH
jgi:nucleotide-binding universal stress UspA family protein